MSTDFFDRQESARRQTTRLLVLFTGAVTVLVAALYLVALWLFGRAMVDYAAGRQAAGWWQPQLFFAVAGATLVVVGLGSMYKIWELAAGGQKVALLLGGRQIPPQSRDLAERRLLNVVEEMALASGVPVPPVYVLDHEAGINAFAAGHRPADAVVAVSRGALQYLNRDELQGVVAHEFSHILNGDMRLNLRLLGLVHGILVLAIVGYYLMRISATSSNSRSSSKDGDNGALVIVILGLALMVLGYLGTLCGRIIQAAISRQREYLADASAVQFTRNPPGIAGALKKIGGLAEGARIRDAHAAEMSHMFFGDALAGGWFSLFGLLATHPPLLDRIRRWDPDFTGQYPAVQPVDEGPAAEAEPAAAAPTEPIMAGLAEAAPGTVRTVPVGGATRAAAGLLPRVGTLEPAQMRGAAQLLAGLPPDLPAAAREPYSARALIFALLLSGDPATRQRQTEDLRGRTEEPCFRETLQLAQALAALSPTVRLPLAQLTTAALRHLTPDQYRAFRQAVESLVAADGQVDLFEYSLRMLLFGGLDVVFGLDAPPTVRYRSLAPLLPALGTVLSALAYAGQSDQRAAGQAFAAAAAGLPGPLDLCPMERCALADFDRGLRALAQAAPALKRSVLEACTRCVSADGQITEQEEELLRVIAAALGCPIGLAAA